MKTSAFIVVTVLFTALAAAQMKEPLELRVTDARVAAATVRSVTDGNPSRLVTTPVTPLGEHVTGLTAADMVISKGRKRAEILDVRELTSQENTVMRIVLFVDNSQSMSPHLELLRSSLEGVLSGLSDAVRVSVLFFSEAELAEPAFAYNGKGLPLVRLPYTTDKRRAVTYINNMLAERLLSRNTYLYDGVFGVFRQLATDTGRVDRSFAIVFSDGADTQSTVDPETVLRLDPAGTVFYTIDYLTQPNAFLERLAAGSGGEHFAAANAGELQEIFRAIMKKMVARGYEVTYRFKGPPEAALAGNTPVLTMEEDVIRETFPLLPYLFFDEGSATMPARYSTLSSDSVPTFDEASIAGGAMDFYYHVLNIIGSRMRKVPGSTITVTGYIDESAEKGRQRLGHDRAAAVSTYLGTVWGIESGRILVAGGTAPPVPSTMRDTMGCIENRRVEITSGDWDLLKPVTFVRRDASVKPEAIVLDATSKVPEGLASYEFTIMQNGARFFHHNGTVLQPKTTWHWKNAMGLLPASSGRIDITLRVEDNAGDTYTTPPVIVDVREVKRERNRNVTVEGGITKEKISLILFPFDVAEPGERNERILADYVLPRITPDCGFAITGHTDIIGSEEYNLKLSEQRASSVASRVQAATAVPLGPDRLVTSGVGETYPLHSNDTPEGRFYNRTVSILIEHHGK